MEIESKDKKNKSEYIVWNDSKSQIIAGATLKDDRNPVRLERIDVKRNLRDHGIGTKLLRRILEDFENSEIVAQVFSARVDWYRRHGFELEERNNQLVKVRREPQ